MDVSVYHNWLYLINWPEVERMDMDQYYQSIPKTGKDAGLVYHSLWNDSSDYAEEPTFIGRVHRDSLWFNDAAWTAKGFACQPGRQSCLSRRQLPIPASQPGRQSVVRYLENARPELLRLRDVGLRTLQP